ncbi:MAG: acetylglutamate kinase [Candidatus Geothermincolia bacterium]
MKEALRKAGVLLEALPYIKKYYGQTVVIKYGGNAMANAELQDTFAQDVVLMRYVGINPVIVHGGGPQITEYMEKLSLPVRFVDGHRVTDAATMEVAKMVLAGKINKEIVSRINAHGIQAVGLSGDDASLIVARKREHEGSDGPVDLGFVGDVERVNPEILNRLIEAEYIPVVAGVGVDADGFSYNINADHIAAAVAAALPANKLIFLTNTEGVYEDYGKRHKLIEQMNATQAQRMLESGALSAGMLPKLAGCVEAVHGGVGGAHIIDGRIQHAALLEIFTDEGIGTMIVPDAGEEETE